MPRARVLLASLAALVTAGAAGCGEPAPTTVRGHEIRIRMREFRFEPQVIRVPAGRLAIRAFNAGVLAHNVKVQRRERDTGERNPDAPTPPPLGGTDTAQRGETVVGRLRLRPGTYELVCTVANHDNLGMVGTLVVR